MAEKNQNTLSSVLDIMLSCSKCQATFADIYRDADNSEKFHDLPLYAKQETTCRLWLLDCGHLTCNEHVRGSTVYLGGEDGTEAYVACPVCAAERQERRPRKMLFVKHDKKDGLLLADSRIPSSWLTVPPVALDGQDEVSEALRFQLQAFGRFGQFTHKNLSEHIATLQDRELVLSDVRQELDATKQQCAINEHKALASEQQLEVTKHELEEAKTRLTVVERAHETTLDEYKGLEREFQTLEEQFFKLKENEAAFKQFKEREPQIIHYLGVVDALTRECDDLRNKLFCLGYHVPKKSYLYTGENANDYATGPKPAIPSPASSTSTLQGEPVESATKSHTERSVPAYPKSQTPTGTKQRRSLGISPANTVPKNTHEAAQNELHRHHLSSLISPFECPSSAPMYGLASSVIGEGENQGSMRGAQPSVQLDKISDNINDNTNRHSDTPFTDNLRINGYNISQSKGKEQVPRPMVMRQSPWGSDTSDIIPRNLKRKRGKAKGPNSDDFTWPMKERCYSPPRKRPDIAPLQIHVEQASMGHHSQLAQLGASPLSYYPGIHSLSFITTPHISSTSSQFPTHSAPTPLWEDAPLDFQRNTTFNPFGGASSLVANGSDGYMRRESPTRLATKVLCHTPYTLRRSHDFSQSVSRPATSLSMMKGAKSGRPAQSAGLPLFAPSRRSVRR